MIIRNLAFSANRLVMFLPVSLWLCGCINSSNLPAQISSVKKESNKINLSRNILGITSIKTVTTTPSSTMQNILSFRPKKSSSHIKNSQVVIYNQKYLKLLKGNHNSNRTYVVKKGDTIFYIARITGNNFRELVKRNNILAPYNLQVGQILQLKEVMRNSSSLNNDLAAITSFLSKNKISVTSKKQLKKIVSSQAILDSKALEKQDDKKVLLKSKNNDFFIKKSPLFSSVNSAQLADHNVLVKRPGSLWRWPTEGKVIEFFSFHEGEGGNKGIDIAGRKGQDIVAAADGRVVYAGNALRGYGNLIIIKHDQNYLSAYAYNDTMLVREKQQIRSGQKVATMGGNRTDSARLHFEIRYKGKSMNPMQYLPQR